MVVFSNQRLGPHVEILLSERLAATMLGAVATSARRLAEARWELELVRWLEARAAHPPEALDVSEIAWTPEHFDAQRRFLVDAISRSMPSSAHAKMYARWREQISAHPRDSVQVGRRWQWDVTD
jgi:hypothetical protein